MRWLNSKRHWPVCTSILIWGFRITREESHKYCDLFPKVSPNTPMYSPLFRSSMVLLLNNRTQWKLLSTFISENLSGLKFEILVLIHYFDVFFMETSTPENQPPLPLFHFNHCCTGTLDFFFNLRLAILIFFRPWFNTLLLLRIFLSWYEINLPFIFFNPLYISILRLIYYFADISYF